MIHKELDSLIANAMKEKNNVRLEVLRMIKTEFVKKEKNGETLDDRVEASILTKMVAQREDSIKQFADAKRDDLVASETAQLEILKEFAPKEVSEKEIVDTTERMIVTFLETKEEGYKLSMKDTKSILSLVQDIHPSANGKLVSKIIMEQINK